MSALRIAQAILAAASGLAAGYFGLHNGLLFSQLTALIISLSLSLFFVNSSFKSQIAISDLKLIARKHRSSPLYLLPTALLDVIGNQLPIFLITIWFSNELTGQYRMAYMLLALPGAIVGNAISQVFFQRLSNIWPDPVASRKLTIDTWKSMALMGIVPLAITMIFGERLFQIILGESWQEAGKMARILAPMAFSLLIFSPTSTALIVLRMEHHTLYFGLAAIIYRPLMLYIGYVGDSLYLGLGILVFAEIMQNSLYSYVAIRKMNATVASNRLTA
jgi:O-antigen/teichoic acid export membrane protein